ncbi:FtsX-like permease family protein [Candidatus Bathyarchaeota archaeon]|nr:FtsX-like permease family protein [Candidatus Bathyarchaeota archaeon]
MFSYAVKRITRGGGLFLSLFLSVALASTLFSGILQGADAIGVAQMDDILESAYVDIISSSSNKNITQTHYWDIDETIEGIDGVVSANHYIRWSATVEFEGTEKTIETIILAIPEDSSLYDWMTGVDSFQDGAVYIDADSFNATRLLGVDSLTVAFNTYIPIGMPDFQMRRFELPVAGSVTLGDDMFQIVSGKYNVYLNNLISGSDTLVSRSVYNMVLVSENTLIDMLDQVLAEERRPTVDQTTTTLVALDRERIVNPWDIQGSISQITLIHQEINTKGASFLYIPRSYLSELLTVISSLSNQMKTSTILVTIPVFFCAWYMGMTLSDILFNLRKREIGLLFTRGMQHRQVLLTLILEGVIIGLLASLVGILGGAASLVLVIPEMSFLELLRSINPMTIAATLIFSMVLTLVAVYKPAQRATQINIVDALNEFLTEDESVGGWQEHTVAFLLGLYKMAMLSAGLTVEEFRPSTSNLIVTLLYSSWWGIDYILGYIAPILFFWGLIKLFIRFVPGYQAVIGRLTNVFMGDMAKFFTLISGRNVKRVASTTFMVAIIVWYSVSVIGNVASTTEYMRQTIRYDNGADASVWVYEVGEVDEIMGKIAEIEGVQAVAKETWFSPDSDLGQVPIRAVDALMYKEAVYPDLFEGGQVFEAMSLDEAWGIMERGAAAQLGIEVNDIFMVKMQTTLYPIRIVGFFGKEPGDYWTLQNPTVYVNEGFLKNVKTKFIEGTRIVVDLNDDADLKGFKEKVGNVSVYVEKVDVTNLQINDKINNIRLAGPRRIEELGVYFAGLLASLGVALITSTIVRSRNKELTIMAIRGLSAKQMSMSIALETLSMDTFAIVLGTVVGYVSLRGQVELSNRLLATGFARTVVFTSSSQLTLLAIIGLLLLSTLTPILVMVRSISLSPNLKQEE